MAAMMIKKGRLVEVAGWRLKVSGFRLEVAGIADALFMLFPMAHRPKLMA